MDDAVQSHPASPANRWRTIARRTASIALGIALTTGAYAIIALPLGEAGDTVALSVGEVAPQDILAPRSITYVSRVLTEQARQAAAASVPDVYDPPDTRIARQQVARARQVLDFISAVRADHLATSEQQLADLAAIPDLNLAADTQTAAQALAVSDARWLAVQEQVVSAIEQVMRDQVRADRLDEARRSIPVIVSVDLSEPEVALVSAIAQAFIAPNSFFNQAATDAARQAARDAVAPVSQSFVEGQAVVLGNRVVSEADLEALEALGLREPQTRWQDTVSRALVVLLACGWLALYLARFQLDFVSNLKMSAIFGGLFLVFLLAAKLMIPGHTVLPYLYPAAGLALLLSVIAGPHLAFTTSLALAALVGSVAEGNPEITAYAALGSLVAALVIGRAERVNSFAWAGLAAGAANAAVVLVFRLPDRTTDTIGLATLVAAGLINGLVSASITLAGFFVLGSLFDVTTSLQLVELSRPNHPLLQFMLRRAPGSYQHSLQVANLAEQAAERISANAMLVRVGALYHDVGKALRPQFYVENQLPGENVHEKLDPATSAGIIIGHIQDGLTMAAQHRLPGPIRAFIPEHHGTLLTRYQYTQAVQAAGGDAAKVDERAFRYPGPRPQSKETALLMLADGCEAKIRSDRPATVEEIDRIVKAVFDSRIAQGQLDECGLTLKDLQAVRESFVATFKGMFHARVQYPEEPHLPLTSHER